MNAQPEPEPGENEPEPEITEEDAAEPEDETAPGQEPAPRQTVVSTQTLLAERDKKLTQETKRHENALTKIYGDDWSDLAPCPLCLTDGYVIPAPPGAMPPEQWEAIEMAAGQESDTVFLPAEFSERCDKCDGRGEVLTGAQTEHGRLTACRKCNGSGWVDKVLPLAAVPQWTPQQPPMPPPENLSLDWTRPRDGFGRPEGHPRFGIDPAVNGGGVLFALIHGWG